MSRIAEVFRSIVRANVEDRQRLLDSLAEAERLEVELLLLADEEATAEGMFESLDAPSPLGDVPADEDGSRNEEDPIADFDKDNEKDD